MTRAYIAKGIYGCLAYLEVDDMATTATYSEAPYTPWGTDPSAKKGEQEAAAADGQGSAGYGL